MFQVSPQKCHRDAVRLRTAKHKSLDLTKPHAILSTFFSSDSGKCPDNVIASFVKFMLGVSLNTSCQSRSVLLRSLVHDRLCQFLVYLALVPLDSVVLVSWRLSQDAEKVRVEWVVYTMRSNCHSLIGDSKRIFFAAVTHWSHSIRSSCARFL